jgi:glycosyltransferase involved in cell wall biosynthesis
MRKHVEIIEPSASGHHLALYVRYVLPGLMEAGYKVSLLTTKEAAAHPAMDLVRDGAPGPFPIRFLPSHKSSSSTSTYSLLMSQLYWWWSLFRHYRKISVDKHPDIIYLPTADWVVKAIEILGSPFGKIPFALLYMSPKHHRHAVGIGSKSRNDRLYDFLFRRLLTQPRLQSILVIDELFYEFAQQQYGDRANKITYVPDFGVVRGTLTKQQCRSNLGISQDAQVLLVYGYLTTRKGILQLLEAISGLDHLSNLVVLLAGAPSVEIKQILDSEPCTSLNRNRKLFPRLCFHDSNEEYEVFCASDLVWLGYTHGFSGSSGVLHKALSLGLPVAAMETGLVGHLVRKYDLGFTVDPNNKAQVQDTLTRWAVHARSFDVHTRKVAAFTAVHNSQMHKLIVTQALENEIQKSKDYA